MTAPFFACGYFLKIGRRQPIINTEVTVGNSRRRAWALVGKDLSVDAQGSVGTQPRDAFDSLNRVY
jgi:hypothetical protein